jgi:WXXGXW repeat (2 copies)
MASDMKPNINRSIRTSGTCLRLAGGLGLLALAGLAAPSLPASPMLADISINIGVEGPPPPRHEVIIGVRPGPDYIWVGGFWDGSPGHYTWVGGHWDRPPHGHAQWYAPHWDKDRDGHWHQTRGEWR